MVSWDDFIVSEGRRRFAVWCGRCGEKRYLPSYTAKLETLCLRCANAEKARNYRLENPSGPERNIIRQLSEMGILFEREVPLKWYNIDFVISGTHAIEMNGGNVHTLRDPQREEQRRRLIEKRYKLLILSDADTKHCKRKIKEFLLT